MCQIAFWPHTYFLSNGSFVSLFLRCANSCFKYRSFANLVSFYGLPILISSSTTTNFFQVPQDREGTIGKKRFIAISVLVRSNKNQSTSIQKELKFHKYTFIGNNSTTKFCYCLCSNVLSTKVIVTFEQYFNFYRISFRGKTCQMFLLIWREWASVLENGQCEKLAN